MWRIYYIRIRSSNSRYDNQISPGRLGSGRRKKKMQCEYVSTYTYSYVNAVQRAAARRRDAPIAHIHQLGLHSLLTSLRLPWSIPTGNTVGLLFSGK